MDTSFHVFSHLCGQQIDHTWLPGGLPLPVCQRCTGLYIGAVLAAALLVWFRPRLEGWFLWLHGVFLVAMAPCGLHWIGNGPEARTISGLVFGAAVVLFLTLWPMTVFGIGTGSERVESPPRSGGAGAPGLSRLRIRGRAGAGCYVIGLGAAAVVLPVVGDSGGAIAAGVLAAGIAAGALILTLLVVWNVVATVWRAPDSNLIRLDGRHGRP